MSKLNRLMVLCIAALCSQHPYAQSQVVTSIEELFLLADENSTSIQAYRTGMKAADQTLKAAKAQRLPDINTSVSASYLGDGRLWDRGFGYTTRIDMPYFGNNFAIEAQQVIYAGGAINSSIRLAELEQQLAELEWQKNRQEIRFLLAGYYLDLYKLNNQLQVLQKNLELTEQMIAHMEARRREGTVLQNDITRYELQRETLKLQLAQVTDARTILNHRLVTTLHLPEGTEITPDTTLLEHQVQTLAEDDWQALAMQSHIGLRQAEAVVHISEQKVQLERSARLPQVALVAADHLDGPITIEVPVLDNNFNYWYVGVGVKYSLSSLFKNGSKLKQARLNVRRAQESQRLVAEEVENVVQAGYTNFLTSFTDLRTQENSVRLANQNYDVTSNRYRNEMALLTDLLDASNMKLSADLGLVNARINVLYNYYKMKYLTHTL